MNTATFLSSILLSTLVLLSNNPANAKRILLIFPAPSYSHQIVYQKLARALHERGHEIVILTTDPIRNATLINYKEIDFSYSYDLKKTNDIQYFVSHYRYLPAEIILSGLFNIVYQITLLTLENPELQKLYAPDSNEKFDAVIVEDLYGYALYAFAHRFNAPLIGITSVDLDMFKHYGIGCPILPSHLHNWEFSSSTGINLPFWRRLINFVRIWIQIYRWNNYVEMEDKIVKKFFGKETPHVQELQSNMSMRMINMSPVTSYPIPMPKNVVLFSGFHIAKTPPVLPKNLKNFLDKATDGFIYISFGSNVKLGNLPPNALEVILNTVSKLPYKILWKCEEELPNKPTNVFTMKWIPQQGVLAHPNIKLFVTQGGLQSMEETVYYGVPILGIPLIFEQEYRVTKMQSLGTGRLLYIDEINEQILYNTIYDVASNPMYNEKMKEVSSLLKDTPYDHVEHVIWWIEHVMRHKGARHLRFSGADEPWYKRYDFDVIAALSVITFISILLVVTLLVRCSLWYVKRFQVFSRFSNDTSSTGNKKKAN